MFVAKIDNEGFVCWTNLEKDIRKSYCTRFAISGPINLI